MQHAHFSTHYTSHEDHVKRRNVINVYILSRVLHLNTKNASDFIFLSYQIIHFTTLILDYSEEVVKLIKQTCLTYFDEF